jgi:predicted enzyme related to lactoylglutathione lyase
MKLIVAWYNVTDFEQAKKFYSETLGLKKTFEMQNWAEFADREGASSIGVNATGGSPGPGGATVVFEVNDVNAAQSRLAKSGVQFVGEVQEIPGVVRIATFQDPFGNQLQLAQSLMA